MPHNVLTIFVNLSFCFFIGKDSGLLVSSSTGGTLNIDLSLATVRLLPDSTKLLSFDIPVIATGGHATSIANENLLKIYLQNLVRYERYSSSIFNQLQNLQNDLAGIWQSKANVYFESLQAANDLVQNGINPSDYTETVSKISAVKYSYINFNSFVNALVNEFQDPSKTAILQALTSFQRRIKLTVRLEVIPKIEPIRFIDTNGFNMRYSGSLCVYQLCFQDLENIEVDVKTDKDFIIISGNTKRFNASKRLHFGDNDIIQLTVYKHSEKLAGKLTSNVILFDKNTPIEITLDKNTFEFSSNITLISSEEDLVFKIFGTGPVISTDWNEMVKSITGEAHSTKTISSLAKDYYFSTVDNTRVRLDAIEERKNNAAEKYQNIQNVITEVKTKADKAILEHQKKESDYKIKLLQLENEQQGYSSFIKQNASLLLIEQDVTRICALEKCKDECVPLMACDVCQKPVKIHSKQWDCKTIIEEVHTSQLVEVYQICKETKYFFIPRYTGMTI